MILIVEDDVYIRSFLALALSIETAYPIRLVADAHEALQVIQESQLHLFILDYHLPFMDGITLYDTIHMMKGREAIPTIMLSGDLPEQEIARREIIGMRKPVDLDDLLATIHKLLS